MRSLLLLVSMFSPVAFALVTIPSSNAATPSSPRPSAITLQGPAAVLDGDTLDVLTATARVRVRLEGIDAPEGGQRCNLQWLGTWDCGRAATLALAQMVEGKAVTCDDVGTDKYGRTLGICRVENVDINAELVRAGLAWAFTKYSWLYVEPEHQARAAKRGVWQASTMTPWDWRAKQRQPTQASGADSPSVAAMPAPQGDRNQHRAAAPGGCAIKGNITRNGRIYHTHASPWYERIRMDLGQGRRWFCTEAEAQEAGWRPAGTGAIQ